MPSQRNTHESSREVLELRRARGEVACAECRRLKLKCDRTIPCSSCVRRTCPGICPNGTRAAFTDKKNLHLKLVDRIRQLENALQIAHAAVSSVQHPLLSEDLLEIKSCVSLPLDANDDASSQNYKDERDKDTIQSYGTLTVSEHGDESYISSVDDVLVVKENGSPRSARENDRDMMSPLPAQVEHLSQSFPFTPLYVPVHKIQTLIEDKLPSYERASALAEAYLENLSWFFRPIGREQIMEELIPTVYKRRRASPLSTPDSNSSMDPHSAGGDASRADPHALGLLLMVFALGAVVDLTLAPCNDEGELYYHLSRAAISLKSVFDGASLQSVQAVILIGAYDIFSCRKSSLDGAWKMVGFGMSLAASIGLHRDPARWKLPSKTIHRRRIVFWELYSFDTWKSIVSGRPMIFNSSVVDCEYPPDVEATLSEDGTEIPSVWRWRHSYIREVMTDVVEKLNCARAMKYSEIVALDQKIREFSLRQPVGQSVEASSSKLRDYDLKAYLDRYNLDLFKNITLLHLHHNFFARAVRDEPTNPLRSAFAPSFLSSYRSAAAMLRIMREVFDGVAHILLRVWPIWADALSASVVLGTVAGLGTSSALAAQAFVEFDLAIHLFAKAQMHPVVKSGLPILLQLREKADRALNPGKQDYAPTSRPPESEGEKEFNVVSGMGRLLRKGFARGLECAPLSASQVISSMDPMAAAQAGPSSVSSSATPISTLSTFPAPRADTSFIESLAPGVLLMTGLDANIGLRSGERTPSSSKKVPTSTSMEVDRLPFSVSSHGSGSTPQTLPDLPPAPAPRSQEFDFSGMMGLGFHSSTDCPPGHTRGDGGSYDVNHSSLNTDPPSDHYSGTFDAHAASGSGSSSTRLSSGMFLPMDDDLSSLSPSMVFNSDFDVGFDVRAIANEENSIPQDMEAWCAILQNSHFLDDAAMEGRSA
ncbi:fungal-specific transcription factor domain-containing protein [Phellopilus nigrolimitatus]|nr:fungal-specific transcription factor domain-containing protein [Phellopilus nigrolimitatus]